MLLWIAHRGVYAWALHTPEHESLPSGAGADLTQREEWHALEDEPDLAVALRTVLEARRSGADAAGAIADACQRIQEWCTGRGWMTSAFRFAEAAAAAEPRKAHRANQAGLAARRAVQYAAAQEWYYRAAALARGESNHVEYVWAQVGLGRVFHHLGDVRAAMRHYRRGANRAQQTGRRAEAADVYHDMMSLIAEAGPYGHGEMYARKALELYPLKSPKLPYFAHDLAVFLLSHALYRIALDTLDLALPFFRQPGEQLLVWGNIARAAGGARDRERFQEAADHARRLAPDYPEHAAAALRAVADGARGFPDWAEAEALAVEARETAAQRGEAGDVERDARLWAHIEAREPMPPEAEPQRGSILFFLLPQLRNRLQRHERIVSRARDGG